jgi:glycosyltransferase involved in cell wall biosynthesis
MLVIAKTPPLHDRASGDYRLFQILRTLSRDYEIDFLATHHTLRNLEERVNKSFIYFAMRDGNFNRRRFEFVEEKYFDDLRAIGVNPLNEARQIPLTVRPTNDYDIRPALAAKTYDAVWVEFFYVADYYLDQIRRFQPWATLIVDSVDLHYKRLERQADYLKTQVRYVINAKQEKKPLGSEHKVEDHFNYSARVRQDEINVYRRADRVIAVSEDDRRLLEEDLPAEKILYIPNVHRQHEEFDAARENPWHKRHGLIFVGNFYHNPNVTSAIWIKHELAPRLEIGSVPVYVVGTNPPYAVKTMMRYGAMAKNFRVTGHVPSTFEYLNKARVSIAPVLFGAGMNGKIGEAMAAGVPVVTTTLGARGMGLTHEENCLVGDTPEEFAACVKRLYEDEALWEKIRDNAKRFLAGSLVDSKLAEQVKGEVARAIDLPRVRAGQSKRKHAFPRV